MFNLFQRNNRLLEQHQFFSTLRYWITVEIDNIPVQSRVKKNVISKFLKIKFSTFDKNFSEFIKDETNFQNATKLENLMLNCINIYEQEALQKGVPMLFLEKFRKWNEKHTEITFTSIRSICESKFYSSTYEKTAAVLDILLFSFRLTIVDAEKTINELNGELERILKGTIFDN
jgi:hypothetical protein